MASHHGPFNNFVNSNKNPLPSSRVGLASAMQELDRHEKSPFQQLQDKQKWLRRMDDDDFYKLCDENKPAIDSIRKQQGDVLSLLKYTSHLISEAERTLNVLKEGGAESSKKLLERMSLCMMIEEYERRKPSSRMLRSNPDPSPFAQDPAVNGKSCGLNLQNVLSSVNKSIEEGRQGRNPPPHPAGPPKPKPVKNFYGLNGIDTDMDKLFGGPPVETAAGQRLMISSSLSLLAPIPNARMRSLDLVSIKDRPAAMANAAYAAISRMSDSGFVHGFVHKPNNNFSSNARRVSDGVHGRICRPLSAPAPAAAAAASKGRERKSQAAAPKVPVEGSNRDQAIAIDSSDEEQEGEGKDKGTKAQGHQYNTRRSSESALLSNVSIDDDAMTDAKRYEVRSIRDESEIASDLFLAYSRAIAVSILQS